MARILIALCILALTACGNDAPKKNNANNGANNGGNNGANNGGTIDPDEIGEVLWNAVCDAVFECPNRDYVLALGRFESVEECQASIPPGAFNFDTNFTEPIDAGRLSFDSSKAGECISRMKELLCGGGFATRELKECADAVTGLVEEGGNCLDDQECVEGFECGELQDQCYGECIKNCSDESCSSAEFCDAGTCVPLKSEGDACTELDQCDWGLWCYDGACNQPGTKGSGDFCASHIECGEDLFCFDSSCGSEDFQPQGETCQVTAPFILCEPGLTCRDIDGATLRGTCDPPAKKGDPCFIFFECTVGLTCQGTPGERTCQDPLADGEPCEEDRDCQSDFCLETCQVVEDPPDMMCALP